MISTASVGALYQKRGKVKAYLSHSIKYNQWYKSFNSEIQGGNKYQMLLIYSLFTTYYLKINE